MVKCRCLAPGLCCCSLATQSCPALCDPMDSSTPGFPVLHCILSLLKLMSIELVMPSNHLVLCCPLLLLPSIFPSIRVFPNKSALHIRWPKYWSFSISPSNEYSGLISFRIDCSELQRRQWHPTPVLLSGKSHGWRSLVDCSPWGR